MPTEATSYTVSRACSVPTSARPQRPEPTVDAELLTGHPAVSAIEEVRDQATTSSGSPVRPRACMASLASSGLVGGGYFFVPSLTARARLARLAPG